MLIFFVVIETLAAFFIFAAAVAYGGSEDVRNS